MYGCFDFKVFPDKLDGVKIEGYRGRWHSIDRLYYGTHCLYLMEHDIYGDMTESLIIDEDFRLIVPDVWNGFEDFEEALEFYAYDVAHCETENQRLDVLAKYAKE